MLLTFIYDTFDYFMKNSFRFLLTFFYLSYFIL